MGVLTILLTSLYFEKYCNKMMWEKLNIYLPYYKQFHSWIYIQNSQVLIYIMYIKKNGHSRFMQTKINTTQIYINSRIKRYIYTIDILYISFTQKIYLYNIFVQLYSNKNSMNYYHKHIKNKKIHNAV